MIININNLILDNFELKNEEFLVDKKHYNDYSGIQEYRLYSYLTTYFNNIKILDIGTNTGRSAISLSHNENNKVISYDIVNHINNSNHNIYKKNNITFKISDVLDDMTEDFIKDVKIVMIDIDHFGKNEKLIIDKLIELNYSGLILLDDIFHPSKEEFICMQDLWNNIDLKKYDITSYGHFSGTGIVLMNTDIEINTEKTIIVKGIGGLGNCLFQIATAIYYSEKYGYKIYLDDKSVELNYGTSNFTNRSQQKTINGINVSYKETIFNKLNFTNCQVTRAKIIHNDYSNNKYIPIEQDNNLVINGYCQNKDLFADVRNNILNYLNVGENESLAFIKNKYGIDESKKNIMLGIRICDDFKHMNKITSNSYKKALYHLVNEMEDDYNLIIISDTVQNINKMINFEIKGNIIIIQEDDITQINAGLLCNNFILSESTYHYWIAYLKSSLDESSKVICFNNTDITNRNLDLDNWIKIDY